MAGLRLGFGCVGWAVALVQMALMGVVGFLQLPPFAPHSVDSSGSLSSGVIAAQRPKCPEALNEAQAAADVEQGSFTPWEHFREWTDQRGIWVHPALEMQQPAHGPRGIYAAVPIRANATLVRVPAEDMVTVPSCLAESPLATAAHKLWYRKDAANAHRELLMKTAAGASEGFWQQRLTEWRSDDESTLDSLVIVLCLMDENSRGSESRWASWLAVLPQSHAGAPLAMEAEELDTCFSGSSSDVPDAAKNWKQASLLDYLLLVRELPEMRKYSVNEFLHWQILVGSRTHGFKLPVHGGNGQIKEHKALVPFIDMVNHNHEGRTAIWKYDREAREFLVQAEAKGIARGKEVTVSYNVRSDAELFLFYGFSDGMAHREASLRLDVDTRKDPLAYEKRDLLLEQGLFRMFKLRTVAPLSNEDLGRLMASVRICAAETAEELEALSNASMVGSDRIPPALEARALRLLATTARRERDERLPASADSEAAGRGPAAPPMCLSFRAAEAELFREVEAFANAALPPSLSGCAGSAAGHCRGGPEDAGAVAEPALPKWIRSRVESYTRWYVVEAGGNLVQLSERNGTRS